MKIILTLLISISIYGQKPSDEKVSYFLTLINVEKEWGNLAGKEYNKVVAKTPVFKLVEKELKEYFLEVFAWKDIKKSATVKLQELYTEEELNKLIAIHELPVMKKFSKNQNETLRPHLRMFVKSRLKKDDSRFLEIKKLLKKRYKEKNVKSLKK